MSESDKNLVTRQPAVAGQFYPSNPDSLRSDLKKYFSRAIKFSGEGEGHVVAVICPHAGYVFSAGVAASSINQLPSEGEYTDIFVIGSSHRASFEGAAIYNKGNFATPLGIVKVDIPLANKLIKEHSDIFSGDAEVHRQEHSLEVQLPFLQYHLKKEFKIVPVLLGTQTVETCQEIAGALKPYLTMDNLFVISSDFSHYPSYPDAIEVDHLTAKAIESNSPDMLIRTLRSNASKRIPDLVTSLCGWPSVLTFLYMTQGNSNVSITPVQYKNSGDSPYGDKDKVVGYFGLKATLKVKKENRTAFNLSDVEKKKLLTIARQTIEQYLQNKKIPEINKNELPKALLANCGAFVTLTKAGELRGCIGNFTSNEALYEVVQQMAVSAATQDPRFPEVEKSEVPQLRIEISVLTPMKRIHSIDEIILGKHGIYIKKGFRSGTFLPQVAKSTGWSKEEFLGHCARDKAGIGWDGWKDAELYTYEAYVFSEEK